MKKFDYFKMLNQADAFFYKQNFAIAFYYYCKIIKVSPNVAGLHHRMGVCMLNQNKLDVAIKHLEKAIELDNNNHEYLYCLGLIYFAADFDGEAFEYFDKAAKNGNKQAEKFLKAADENWEF